MHNIKFTKI